MSNLNPTREENPYQSPRETHDEAAFWNIWNDRMRLKEKISTIFQIVGFTVSPAAVGLLGAVGARWLTGGQMNENMGENILADIVSFAGLIAGVITGGVVTAATAERIDDLAEDILMKIRDRAWQKEFGEKALNTNDPQPSKDE